MKRQIPAFLFREIKENGSVLVTLFVGMTVFSGLLRFILLLILTVRSLPGYMESGRIRLFSTVPFSRRTVLWGSFGLVLFTGVTAALLHTLIFTGIPTIAFTGTGIYHTIVDQSGVLSVMLSTMFFFGLLTVTSRRGISSVAVIILVFAAVMVLRSVFSFFGSGDAFDLFNPLRFGTDVFNPLLPLLAGIALLMYADRSMMKGGMSR